MITHQKSLEQFSGQIRYALDHYTGHGINISEISNVVLGGLGGSGIAGAIVKSWAFDHLRIPLETVSDYDMPAYVNNKTLVVLNSYSGNTEETLNMLSEALAAGARVVVLTSGGEIGQIANEHGLKKYTIETGFQPRQTIGYGLSYLLMIIAELKSEEELNSCKSDLENTITFFEENNQRQIASAESIYQFFSSSLKNKFVILADKYYYPVALRFSQQLNENAKLEAFVHPVPESNHNVTESYIDRLPTNFVMLFSTKNPRVEARFDFLAGHLELDNNKVLPMRIEHYDITTIMDMIYRLDWVSVIIAEEIGAPMMEVPVISELKDFLSDFEVIEDEADPNDQ